METITKQKDLTAFCKSVEDGKFITVDTEFIRDKTYFPKLCLLQIASEKEAAIIDPLAPDLYLEPVFALLQNPKLVKVFHAARQDIEIFYLLSNHIPAPIFDTQVAAAVCGYGESVSYETLVNKIVGQDLDKSSRFTDWAARPLSERQLSYALSDVTHLRTIYTELCKQIDKSGRTAWISEEHARLSDPALYKPDPENAWKKLKFGNMRPKNLAALRELAKWREIDARTHDVPRGRIVKDDVLIELAFSLPRKESELSRMRGLEKHMSKNKIDGILQCIETALALPASEYPSVKAHRKPPQNVISAVAMLQLLLKVQADVHSIASSMIAGKDELEAIALGETDLAVFEGWRNDIFGKSAQALMAGKLKLSLDPKSGQVLFDGI